jgi:hypothetical protein
MRPIEAQALVAAPVDEVWGLLADLREHWLLADRWTEVLGVDGDGGTIRLRGPLGVRREVHVRVTMRLPARELEGLALLGTRTAARVRWELAQRVPRATCVTLRAEVLSAAFGDRVLLALGARRWLRWRFAVTLRRLNDRLGASASQTLLETSSQRTL